MPDTGGHQLTDRRVNGSVVQTFNKPAQIIQGDLVKRFEYGPHQQRYRQVTIHSEGTTLEVFYLAGGAYTETRLTEAGPSRYWGYCDMSQAWRRTNPCEALR